MKRIYFDYASTTPLDKRVKKEMDKCVFGNTMSLHSFGQEAKRVLEASREKVAGLINAKPNEIIFTSSATESNNLALKGLAFKKKKGSIVISAIEHPSILESAKWLSSQGFVIKKAKVDKYGKLDISDIEKLIEEDTFLVSIIHASNEVGTIQDIEKIRNICKKAYVHIDASQSFGKIPIDVKKLGVDLLTASSHKMYGPKGVALLYIREGLAIEPLLHGGGQEQGLRSSTINLPAIAGFAKACQIAKEEMQEESARLRKLRDRLAKGVLRIKGSYLNGHPKDRLANNAHFRFDFIEGESLVVQLDLAGIACSTGSACSSIKLEPSHVLLALGLKPEQAHGSLRVSLGKETTEKDIDYFLLVLPKIINQLRLISPFKWNTQKK
ncbi:cysteine desulfurase [Patescibacteria group bacterium]|nr:cysteine desulfurase [Patescibacteria group bacterium]